jgi:hypothetical protein
MQIQVTEAQASALKALAAREGVSIAEVVRQGIERRLADDDWSERRRRALAVAGRFSGGPPDLGRRHDDYLAEAYAQTGSSTADEPVPAPTGAGDAG